jgi:hypothetical protein
MTLRGSLNNAVEGQDVQTLPGGGTGKPRWARELRAEEHREPSPPPSAQPILVTTRPRSLLPVAEIAHRLTIATVAPIWLDDLPLIASF